MSFEATVRTAELVERVGHGLGLIDLRFAIEDALRGEGGQADVTSDPLPLDATEFEAAVASHTRRAPRGSSGLSS